MPELKLVLAGGEADAAADALEAALAGDGGAPAGVTRSVPAALPAAERKVVDPVALASLVLSIPGAVLAVMDLADRIRKRRRATALVEAATRLRVERRVETYAVTLEGPKPLADMTADALLELVGKGG